MQGSGGVLGDKYLNHAISTHARFPLREDIFSASAEIKDGLQHRRHLAHEKLLTEANPPRVSRLIKLTAAASGMDLQAFPLSRVKVYWDKVAAISSNMEQAAKVMDLGS